MRMILGITAGDPAGIGLEVTLKALSAVDLPVRRVLFTTHRTFDRNKHHASALPFRWIESVREITDDSLLFIVPIGDGDRAIDWGQVNAKAGAEAIAGLQAASNAALKGDIDGIVTAPVNKFAIGGGFHGQTDFLAAQAHRTQYAMAFFAPTLKVVLATVHIPLREALNRISTSLYVDLIRFVDAELKRLQFGQQRIAVAAINPHAGEGGVFGDEDDRILRPAVEACAAQGIDVSGPHPADSLYYLAHTGQFDVVIAPYHDQGLAPIKLIAHGDSTNVTLGLPYVRTSPDHGTAFAIAGQGQADPAGMVSALKCAVDLIRRSRG